MQMIGLPIDQEKAYRAFEDFYHSWCSQCVSMTKTCRIMDCMKRGGAPIVPTGNKEYGD